MKKLFCLLAAFLLVLSCAVAEESGIAAETPDTREADLLDIYRTDGGERTWITAAVQAMDGMLLTSPALLPDSVDSLVVSDGTNEWKVEARIPDCAGVVAMLFYDAEKNPSQRKAWPLMPFGDSVKASTCLVRSGSEGGVRTDCGIRSAGSLEWNGCRCLLLDVEGEAPVGAAVLNERGELAGLVIAGYAQGTNRVLALPADEIARAMTEAGTVLKNLYSWGDPLEGYRVTAEKNLVTIDWSAVTLPEKAEGEQLYLVVADVGNDYLNFYPAEETDRTIRMVLAPGRIYLSGILACSGSPSEIPEHYEVTVIPEAQRLEEYGFTPTLTAVAEMPEDAKEDQAPVPVTEVTEELLRSGRAWFYSASRYEVAERIPDKTLLVTLSDPSGNVYRYESSWVYDPEYMNDDVWYVSLAGMGLTYSLDQNGYPRGEYRMAYYVDGDLADAFTFELK